jgi:segregation and condensation protein B
METGQLKGIIEAALLAYGQPLGIEQLREIFDEFERPDATAVLLALADDCEGRPMELVEVASGWRLQVRGQFSTRLSKLWQERPTRYSRALLETLALIAYRQPITRGEIEDVRGVTVNPNIVRTLTERGWIRVVGPARCRAIRSCSAPRASSSTTSASRVSTSCRRSRRCVTWTTSASSSSSTDR